MIDVKKFITGFLILAAAAGGSGFILSTLNFSSSASNGAGSDGSQVSISTASSSALGNFFPTENPSNGFIATVPATSTDANNLTSAFADAFMNGVTAANPDGLTNDNGIQVLVHPDTQSVASQVAQSPALANVPTPDWNTEADIQPIKTVQDSSPAAISAYSNSLTAIFNEHIVANNIENEVGNPNIDASEVASIQTQVQQTLSDVLQLPTPKPLMPFQKSLVTMLVYSKNSLALAANPGDDPLKTVLVFQNEENSYDAAVQSFQDQMKNAAALQGFSFGQPAPAANTPALSFIDTFIGVRTAHAQWLTFDAANLAQMIKDEIKNILIQILKNTMISLIQAKVLTWIKGSGAPRFVQDWATEVTNAYQQTALNYLNSKMACGTYSGWLPNIQTTLGAYYKNTNNICANEFQQSLGAFSLQQYQNYFENGGFLAFGASNLPSGNMYGDLWFQAQIAGYNANQAAQVTQAQNIASNGLKGSSACGDNSNPNTGTHTVCESLDGDNYTIDNGDISTSTGQLPKCDPSDKPVVMPNAGICSDGSKPSVTTPAVFTGFASQSAIDSSPKLASAANDIAGVLNAVLGSLLSSMANEAISAANNAVQGGLWSINSGSIQQSGVSPSTVPSVPLSCAPLTQTVTSSYPFSVSAQGGALDTNGFEPTYFWSAPAFPNAPTSTGFQYYATASATGTFQIFLTDSTGDATSTCIVTVVP